MEIWHEGSCVARHERCYGRHQQMLDLEHYLDVLEQKPGALAGSTPLEQWRERGRWPESLDRFWQKLKERHGKQQRHARDDRAAALGSEHGMGRLQRGGRRSACAGLHGCGRGPASADSGGPGSERSAMRSDLGELARFERPLPVMDDYDQLLARRGGGAMSEHDSEPWNTPAYRQHCKAVRMPDDRGAISFRWPNRR